MKAGKPKYVMTLFSDNSVVLQEPCSNPVKVVSTIFPPPTSKEIKQVLYCMNLDKIFLLLATGIICVYILDPERQNSATL